MTPAEWIAPVARGCLGTLGLAFLLAVYRLLRGPSLPDRAAALDAMALNFVGVAAVTAVLTGERWWLDVGIVVVVIGLLGSVTLAQYLVRR